MGQVAPIVSVGTITDIKSTAVVKYSSVNIPVQFPNIRLNTDLNYPPSDRHQAGVFMFQDQHMHNSAHRFSQFLRCGEYLDTETCISKLSNVDAKTL